MTQSVVLYFVFDQVIFYCDLKGKTLELTEGLVSFYHDCKYPYTHHLSACPGLHCYVLES